MLVLASRVISPALEPPAYSRPQGHSHVAGMQLRFPARSTHIKAVPALSPTI